MPGFLVPDRFQKEVMTESDTIIASLFFGFTIAFAIVSAGTAMRQFLQCWMKSHRATIYVFMIWGHWLANNAFALISFLYLRDVIQASFWLWFFILTLWVFQSQLIVQIIVNRLSLLIMIPSHARRLKWAMFVTVAIVNISVFVIWIPARLEISNEWIYINHVWDRIEKSIFLLVDASLNTYFVYLVRNRLIACGLTKYTPLYRFNIVMIGISVGLDMALIGMMSLQNDLIYLQFQSVAYAGKLHIEMNMADLIKKVVCDSNVDPMEYSGTASRSTSRHLARNAQNALDEKNIQMHNSRQFISRITRGANVPYRGHHETHIELGSLDDFTEGCSNDPSPYPENRIQKTTMVTQTVAREYVASMGNEDMSPLYEASTEKQLKRHKSKNLVAGDYVIKLMLPSQGALDRDMRVATISSERTARMRRGSTPEMTVTPHQHDTVARDEHLSMDLLGLRSRDHQTWEGSPVRPRERIRGQLRKPWTDSDERYLRLLSDKQMRDTASTESLLAVSMCLPLVVKQAMEYMKETRASTTRYLKNCYRSNKDQIKLLSRDFKDSSRYCDIANPITTTWLNSFQHVETRYRSLSLLPDGADKTEKDEAVGILVWANYYTEMARHLARIFPWPLRENRSVWVRYKPHAEAVLGDATESSDLEAYGGLLYDVGNSYDILGKYEAAETMHRKVLELRKEVLGPEHPSALDSTA
ncbi:hypothetical protein JX266_013545 [Neoarthrinium moseri]|nr:hypothetical protein JX266_013545 [Neoarthrinium moseri]